MRRLRRFKGTILVGTLICAAFIADGLMGGELPGPDSEEDSGALTRDTEDGTAEKDRGAGLLNGPGHGGAQAPESNGSRMGGGSRLGGNSVHGSGTGGSGQGLLDPAKPSIF